MSLLTEGCVALTPPTEADPGPEPAIRKVCEQAVDPIDEVLSEIVQMVGGDNLLAAWHDSGEAPAYLTWHMGRAAPPRLAAEMLAAACRVSRTGQPLDLCTNADGCHGIMVMGYPVQGGVVTATVLYLRAEDLDRARRDGMAARRPSLIEPFFRLWVLQLQSAIRATGLLSAMNRLDVAAFHFDEQGRLLFGNETGQALIAAGEGIRQSDESLGGTTLADTIALQSAIDNAIHVARPVAGEGPDCPVIALTRPHRRPLLATVSAIDSDRALPGGTAAVVYVIDPDRELRPRLEPVCKLYCLSPVETKLACLLADGASLNDAASLISVREQTARTYLKQIFAKTRTTRQAELVGLLLKSAILTVAKLHSR